VRAQRFEQALQARSIDELHLEREQFPVVDDAVDVDDVLVFDARESPRFFEESLPARGREAERVRQHLERYLAVERFLPREIDGAHATAPELAHDLVTAERRTRPDAPAGHAAGQRHRLLDAVRGERMNRCHGGQVRLPPVQQLREQLVDQVREVRVFLGARHFVSVVAPGLSPSSSLSWAR
jgi:hypothetical protein